MIDYKQFYQQLITPRCIEERMLIALRQGKISKWFSAWGQEAISVGTALALESDEYICTMHRNLGVFTSRGISFEQLFAQFQGKAEGFTQGRDRSFHFGTNDYHIVGMISHLGSQMGVADGIALGQKLKKRKKATVVFTGDGGASEGDFHEAVNLAAVWDLPLIIIVENNQWGLSTPSNEQFKMKSFADKGIGYGIEAVSIDGNNFVEVYETVKHWAEKVREKPQTILIECNTFRMRGHEEASGTAYYPEGLTDRWMDKDPILRFENFLLAENHLSKKEMEQMKEHISQKVIEALDRAQQLPAIVPNKEKELGDIYAPVKSNTEYPKKLSKRSLRMVDAISEGLDEAMKQHPNLILMGQDIAQYGGVFKITEGFLKKYGAQRVRNTPICEAAVLGAGLGLSIMGYKSMVEMQFSDFVSEGFNQIVNNLAKAHYRWRQHADVVVRMPTGAGVAAGPYHSQSTESWFTHIPGLKVVYPSCPADAKGLLLRAFEDPNPVLFFEHKYLYRSLSADVSEGYYTLPIGKAKVVRKGEDATIIAYGWGVQKAKEWTNQHPEYSIEIIDLRTLLPWDKTTVFKSVAKTGKVLLLSEANHTGNFMAEVAAEISEHCFADLDAPVLRLSSLDTPVPFNATLEKQFLPWEQLDEKLPYLLGY